ncbi:MAG: fibronectin type III domain-containing protein [Alistipes sp.]|nr:fibronectin type III domain-containing protein [Alistipes sp.]
MKKFFSMMMIAAAVFAFAACGNDEPGPQGGGNEGGKLATPELSETHTETSITVSWGAVENAEAYRVNLKGKNYTTEELSYTFENLNAGTYDIRVMATAEGYTDSEMAKISVTITGATSVDWFTQTLSLPEVDETVDYGNGQVMVYQPYNGVKALWKGTDVADIKYGLFATEGLEGVSDAQIKGNLNTFDNITGALELINSADGLEIIYGGCSANTSYTAYVWVKNVAGQEFFTSNEITTSDFEVPAETQAWIGTWNAKTSQVISIGDNGAGTLSAKDETFTLTIAASATAPDMVVIDGLSVLGEDNPTVGYVVENTLTIATNFSIGSDADGITYMWLPFVAVDGELLGLNDFGGEVPAHTLTMAEDGTVTGETGKFGVKFNDGTEAEAEVVCTELYGVSQEGQLYFFIESFPAVYRAGALELTKAATPTAKVLNKEARNFPMSLSSVVF